MANAPRTSRCRRPTRSRRGATGSGAIRSHHRSPPAWPCRRALHRIHRRKSGSAALTADCIASNVARLTLLANSEASSGLAQRRRRLTMLASPLIAFIAAATRCRRRVGQAVHLGVVRRLADGRVGVGGESAHGRHRQALDVSVGERDVGGQLRRDVAVQARPRRRARGGQLGVEALPPLPTSGARRARRAAQRSGVLGGLLAHRGQLVGAAVADVQRADPVGEAGEQRRDSRIDRPASSLSSACACSSRLFVLDRGVDVRTRGGTGARRLRCTRRITASAAAPSSAVAGRGSMARIVVLVEDGMRGDRRRRRPARSPGELAAIRVDS